MGFVEVPASLEECFLGYDAMYGTLLRMIRMPMPWPMLRPTRLEQH